MALAEAIGRRTLAQLPEIVDSLSGYDREIFTSIMKVYIQDAELRSDTMFLGDFRTQPVVKVHNLREHIVAKIGLARALKPQDSKKQESTKDGPISTLDKELKEKEGDAFCSEMVEEKTPLNVFGRVRGESSASGANLYAAGKFHGVLPFPSHDPRIPPTKYQFLDYLDIADRFYEAAHMADERAIYSSYGQNNLDRAGASMWFHGHAQLQQELDCHEGAIEQLLEISQIHRWKTGRDYFEDLFRAHQVVGLGMERNGVRVMPFLTPLKERHIRMVAYAFDEPQRDVLFRILHHYMDKEQGFGVQAFNFSIGYRPISYDGRDWGGFPAIIAEIIDRGDISKRNNDMGYSETLLRSPITTTDLYRVNEGIEKALAA